MRKPFMWMVALFLALAGCDVNCASQIDCPPGQVWCGDRCADWLSDPEHCGECDHACSPDQFCHIGVCIDRCDHECSERGELRCADPPDNGVVSCGDHDADFCLEWGGLQPCGAGETCSGGVCSTTCEDDCQQYNLKACDDGQNGFKTCGYYDDDACLEWSEVTECESGEICINGGCFEGCIEPGEDCKEWDDCCDYPDQGYHCCPVFHFCVKDFW